MKCGQDLHWVDYRGRYLYLVEHIWARGSTDFARRVLFLAKGGANPLALPINLLMYRTP